MEESIVYERAQRSFTKTRHCFGPPPIIVRVRDTQGSTQGKGGWTRFVNSSKVPRGGTGGDKGVRGVHREVNVSREGTGRINFSRGKGPTGRTPPGGTGRGHPFKGGDRKESVEERPESPIS